MNRTDFFILGDCQDLFYRHVRDLPQHEEARAFVETLWQRYQGYEARHFLDEAKSLFVERFWAMYLSLTLLIRGLELFLSRHVGAEWYFVHHGQKGSLEPWA